MPPPRTRSGPRGDGGHFPLTALDLPRGQPQEAFARARLGLGLYYVKAIGTLGSLGLGILIPVLALQLGLLALLLYPLLTAWALLATLLGAAGALLCCWAPARSGARPFGIAALACDAFAFLLGALGALSLAASTARLPMPGAAVLALPLFSTLCALVALGLFLLFVSKLASSLGKRSMAREAVSLTADLVYLAAGTVVGGAGLVFLVLTLVTMTRRGFLCLPGPFLTLAIFWLVVRVARFRETQRCSLSYLLSHEHADRGSNCRLPSWLPLTPVAPALFALGAYSGGLPGLGLALIGAAFLIGLGAWLLVRILKLIVRVRAALPADGDNPWGVVRALPHWLWLVPPAGAAVVAVGFLALLAMGVAGETTWGTPGPGAAASASAARPARQAEADRPAEAAPPPPPERPPRAPPAATDFPGLIAYWPFEDDNPAERVADRSGNGNDGKAVGAARVDGVRGQALAFADRGYFDYGSRPGLNFPAGGAFTLACWVKTTSAECTVISQRHSQDDGADLDLLLSGGRVQAHVRHDGGVFFPAFDGKAVVNDDRWHHLALTRSGKDVVIYVDGAPDGSGSPAEGDGPITTDLRSVGREGRWHLIGRRGPPGYFTGAVDEFCIFNRALAPDEIKALAGR